MRGNKGMDSSAATLNLQFDIKAAEMEAFIHGEFTRNDKNWSDTPTPARATSFGEGLFKVEYARRKHKRARRVGARNFEAVYDGVPCEETQQPGTTCTDENEDVEAFRGVPLPLFHRVRRVHVDNTGVMFCSCCKFERCGYF